jgi:ATP sulfurylase
MSKARAKDAARDARDLLHAGVRRHQPASARTAGDAFFLVRVAVHEESRSKDPDEETILELLSALNFLYYFAAGRTKKQRLASQWQAYHLLANIVRGM